MRLRVIFVVVTAVLLVAGTCSAAACDMTCLPHAQNEVCCTHHTQHAMLHSLDDCGHSGTASLVSAHECGHPQNGAPTFTADGSLVMPLLSATGGLYTQAVRASVGLLPDAALRTIAKPSGNIPLRI